MKQIAKLSLAIVVTMALIAPALEPHSIQAQAPKPPTPVSIVSPIPVPISGDVGAAQRGAWSVAVSNTPTVNVSSLPSIQFASGSVVPTLDGSSNPTNIVELIATAPAGSVGTFALQGPDGSTIPFTSVPNGKTLVLTSGDFLAEHAIAPLINVQFGIIQGDGSLGIAGVWVVSGTSTTVLSWPPGIVIGSGHTPSIAAFGDDVIVRFRGYLIAP